MCAAYSLKMLVWVIGWFHKNFIPWRLCIKIKSPIEILCNISQWQLLVQTTCVDTCVVWGVSSYVVVNFWSKTKTCFGTVIPVLIPNFRSSELTEAEIDNMDNYFYNSQWLTDCCHRNRRLHWPQESHGCRSRLKQEDCITWPTTICLHHHDHWSLI